MTTATGSGEPKANIVTIREFVRGAGKPSLDRLNEIVRAVNALTRTQGDDLIRVSRNPTNPTITLNLPELIRRIPRNDADVVWVKNETGAALERFDAVAIGDPTTEGAVGTASVVYEAVLSGDPLCAGRVAIVQTGLAVDAAGPAVASGVSVAKVKISGRPYGQWRGNADRAGLYKAGEPALQLCELGRVELLWIDWPAPEIVGEDVEYWCVARLGGQRPTQGVTVYEQGDGENRGVAEVLFLAGATVAEVYPGCVVVTPA